jgi:hypothetical protein
MLAIGLFMLSVGAATTLAGNATRASDRAGNAAPIVSSDGGPVTLNEDDDEDDEDEDDEDEEDEDEGGGGGDLPATDTAPELSGNTGSTSPVPAFAILVIAGLIGGTVRVAGKRRI